MGHLVKNVTDFGFMGFLLPRNKKSLLHYRELSLDLHKSKLCFISWILGNGSVTVLTDTQSEKVQSGVKDLYL